MTNFGDGPVRDSGPGGVGAEAASEDDFDPFDEARMRGGDRRRDLRVVSLYAPNGRIVGSPFYAGKLAWFERLARWLREAPTSTAPLVVGGDFNVAPTDIDVWDAAAVHGGTHVSEPERAAFRALLDGGWSTRIDRERSEPGPLHVVGLPGRHVPQEQRDAHRPPAGHRRRSPREWSPPRSTVRRARVRRSPSDHAPLVIDLDEPGKPFDPDWDGALARIQARTKPPKR